MLASEVAGRWFLRRHHLDADATFFRLVPMADRLAHVDKETRSACLQRADDGIKYEILSQAAQMAETTPLFWGDLLHMRQYLNSIRGLLRPSSAPPEDLLLLTSSPIEVVSRAVSFGTTFLYHSATDLTAEEYGPSFRRFLTHARLVMPRDIVSLSQVAAVMPRSSVAPGLDATQLFCGEADWREAFPEGTDTSLVSPDALLCYFARGKHDVADLRHAVGAFSDVFGQPVRWLPWGDRLSFPHLGEYESRLELEDLSGGRAPRLSALLEALAAARCVLTDTYHVAVIAWSLGTPAMIVCGDHWPHDYNAVVDKRYVFCMQHGLQEMFLGNARDPAAVTCFLRRGLELVHDGRTLQWYREAVGQRVEVIETELAAALRNWRSVG